MIFDELHALRRRPSNRHGTPDLLAYSHLVDDGIAALKDGSYLRSYLVQGPDLKSASFEEILALKHQGNHALARLDDGWMVQTDLVRFPSAEYLSSEAIPDPVSQLIERERERHYRAEGAHLETAIYLSVTYRPPARHESWFRRLFFDDAVTEDERVLAHFIATTDTLSHDLSAGLDITALNSGELLSFIQSSIIGEQVTVRPPKSLNYLDLFLGRWRLTTGTKPTIGGRHIRVVVPTGLPLESHGEVCSFLSELPFPYRYSIRAILLGTYNANKAIGERRKHHHQKRERLWDFLSNAAGKQSNPQYLNEHAVDMAEDANEAVKEAESNEVRYVYTTIGVVLIGDVMAEVDEQAAYVRKLFSHHNFVARIEDFNTVEAWRSSLAGDGFSNIRRPLVNTMNLADLMPMTTLWTGDLYNPNPMYPPKSPPFFYATSDGQTAFRFHPHVSDVGHGIIVGPIGAGKSTIIDFMIAQSFRIPDMQVFVFDKGYSSFILTKACGGQHWDLGNDMISAAPLINVDQDIEREWADGYVSALTRAALRRDLTPIEDDALWRALELLGRHPRHQRTITALQARVQNDELKQALTRYTLKGPMGRYIDDSEDALLTDRFITFEMETLQNNEALIPMLLYLFHRIEQRLDGRPTLVVIDEAWVALSKSFFGAKIEEWLRDWRKKNAAVWLATQSLDDLRRSEYRSVILESCHTKVYLPNPEAGTDNIADIYRDFRLSDRQIQIIAEAVAKREYYLVSHKGRRLIDLALEPATLSFVGASSKEHIRRVRELIAEHGARWAVYWLRERGLAEAADELEHSYPDTVSLIHHYTNGVAGSSSRGAPEDGVTP
jgi:type IV secretion system protein VirB4